MKNDNDAQPRHDGLRLEPDAHGQAALLLVESLMHSLVDCGRLTAEEARTAVRIASDAKREIAADVGESRKRMEQSLALLAAIERSFTAYAASDGAKPSPPK